MNLIDSRTFGIRRGQLLMRMLTVTLISWSSGGYCQDQYRYMPEIVQHVMENTVQHSRDAIQKDPNDASAHSRLGEHFLSKMELTSAIECFKKALSIEPLEPRHLGNMATALCLVGDELSALSFFEKCIAAAPQDPEWVLRKAECLLKHGNTEKARQVIGQLRSIEFSEDVLLYKLRGRLFLSLGETGPAEQDLLRYLQEVPTDEEGHYLLGVVLLERGDPSGAIQSLTVAVDISEKVPEFYRRRAEAHVRAGKPDLAARDIEAATRLEKE